MTEIPIVDYRFNDHYYVTSFVTPNNPDIQQVIADLGDAKGDDEFVEEIAEFIRDEFQYPLWDSNPSVDGQLLRYSQGFLKHGYKCCKFYVWAFPAEVLQSKLGYCLMPDTKILCHTAKGIHYKQIKDVKLSDYVFTHRGNLGKVTKLYERPVDEDLVVLYLENGERIKVTANHSIYTTNGWTKARDLTTSSVLYKIGDTASKFFNNRGANNPNWKGGIASIKEKRHCLFCGKEFETYQDEDKHFCSVTCAVKYRGEKSKHPCEVCGKLTHNKHFCSRKCRGLADRGENNPIHKVSKERLSQHFIEMWDRFGPQIKVTHHHFPIGEANPARINPPAGELNPRWQGGISFEPYSSDFNDGLKEQIRDRDNHICQLCGMTEIEHVEVYGEKLSVHHIDYDKKNSNETNLISLCRNCNSKVNANRNHWQEFFENKIAPKYLSIVNGTRITKITREHYNGLVYNLEVEGDHSYTGKGIIFHNCAETANLGASLLIRKVNSCVVLGDVLSTKDDTLLGRHAWNEALYKGETYVLETTIHSKGTNNLTTAKGVYNKDSDWAKQGGVYYSPQARYTDKEYNGSNQFITLMGLPAKRILLFGLEETQKVKAKKLYKELRKENALLEKMLNSAWGVR